MAKRGLRAENGPEGSVIIYVYEDDAENARLLRDITLSREEWEALVRDIAPPLLAPYMIVTPVPAEATEGETVEVLPVTTTTEETTVAEDRATAAADAKEEAAEEAREDARDARQAAKKHPRPHR